MSTPPTAMIEGCSAGLRSGLSLPSFPEDVTTTMPLFQACSTANANGSTEGDCVPSVPNASPSTLMSRPRSLSLRWLTIQSIAAMTWDTSASPRASATFTLMRRALGAIPMYEVRKSG